MSGPCGWTVSANACTAWASYDAATKAKASALAIGLMWAATGRQFGLCQVTVMPENPVPAERSYQAYPVGVGGENGLNVYPVLDAGAWRNVAVGGGCGCTSRHELRLPGPVQAIMDVVIAGVSVDPGAYRVHNRALLVRVDGQAWPSCQRFNGAPMFEITYLRGSPIPANVQAAVDMLACEYGSMFGAGAGGDCRLPARLASLSRQGVDVTIAEVDKTAGPLRTDIQEVDDAIDAVNPKGLSQRPRVMSPDTPTFRTVTWQGAS